MESLFLPRLAALQNKMTLRNVPLQVETLANATQSGLNELSAQVHATSKTALQNQLALGLLLLKEHGVCGHMGFSNGSCCIHIPNVTADLNHQAE